MKALSPQIALATVLSVLAISCSPRRVEKTEDEVVQKIVATSALVRDVTVSQQYVCQIHAQRHINVCALEIGYLEKIKIREGQPVKENELLFQVLPTLYKARLDVEVAEVLVANLEFNNTNRLFKENVVSENELALQQGKLAKAQAKASLARSELKFTEVRAPFDGIVDRLNQQEGSLVKEGEILTTLSDNSVMWVYFNVPESRYLDYMAEAKDNKQSEEVVLVLANGRKFSQIGKIAAVVAKFNNETGNIPFRADFPNPDRLLRHGQTGNVILSKNLKNATVIPQRATFENLDKRYVYVVGDDGLVRQRELSVLYELEDIFVIKSGSLSTERIVLEGIFQVHDGDRVEIEYRDENGTTACSPKSCIDPRWRSSFRS